MEHAAAQQNGSPKKRYCWPALARGRRFFRIEPAARSFQWMFRTLILLISLLLGSGIPRSSATRLGIDAMPHPVSTIKSTDAKPGLLVWTKSSSFA